ncbi:MAG TPA: hypothetical protein VML55_14945 [Planctomycetaceae bacterium]|nr:hypothetical protein [Planctomycetaceae bacterium]
MKMFGVLAFAAAALLAPGRSSVADDRVPVEARPAIYQSDVGAATAARPVQYFYAPYGYTWYGANSYAYAPPSYYVAPNYGPVWPGAYTHTSYRPYYVSHGPLGYSYGWLPYSYQTRPYGSFSRYYGPVYGSGFHMWFGY